MNSTFARLKQVYLGIIPIYPLGYVLVHGMRYQFISYQDISDKKSISY